MTKQYRPGQFIKGQSGNPGGRPKGPGLRELVRERTKNGDEVIAFLLATMRDKKLARKDRLKAAELLMDRGWGRAPQAIALTGEDGGPIEFTEIRRVVVDPKVKP